MNQQHTSTCFSSNTKFFITSLTLANELTEQIIIFLETLLLNLKKLRTKLPVDYYIKNMILSLKRERPKL